ncbi:hypothetical protein [Sporosarcina sp. FSL K6-1508]|uniref:hypothetical protein n=1 Tax=Sporosarcina sp. FSL K6-1508 TaxID=2921553 RepID=UPI0030FABA12
MINYDFVNDLAAAIEGTSEKVTGNAVQFPVFGTIIDGQLNLKADGFGRVIPAADYHKKKGLSLSPGDRVLCVPIEDGHTFILTELVE